MKTFTKRVLAVILSCCCVSSISACNDEQNSYSDSVNGSTQSCTHAYTSEVTKEATCKEAGIKTYTCNVCGDLYTEEIPKSTTHAYTSEVTKEATCKEAGVKTYTCSVCGDLYTEEIPKSTTHVYTSEVTKEATCKEAGTKTYTCNVCGDLYTEEIPKSENHNFTRNGNCTECGLNSTVSLEMNAEEKYNLSKTTFTFIWFYKSLSTDNQGNYILKIAFDSRDECDKFDASALIAVPMLIDITITNSDGDTVYAKTKAVKSSDYQLEDGGLWANVKVNVDELSDTSGTLSKLYFTAYNPGYGRYNECEIEEIPAIIVMPTLPELIYNYYSNGKIKTVLSITNISYEIKSYSTAINLYFSGEKVYDRDDVGQITSRSIVVSYKLYDSEGYVVKSGEYYTPSIAEGEKFRNDKEFCYVNTDIASGKIYYLKIINVKG